jgi:hypothetical protein
MALPKYSDIVDLIKKGATFEAQEKIMELRAAALDLEEENIELRKRVAELEESLEIKNNVIWEAPYYFIEKNGEKEGPFCQHCYDKDGKLIRLQSSRNTPGSWSCLCCENVVRDDNYVERARTTRSGGPGSWMGA